MKESPLCAETEIVLTIVVPTSEVDALSNELKDLSFKYTFKKAELKQSGVFFTLKEDIVDR